ncbi:SDR family NAD(P)-dependent oxidoreductase [Streptomyces sp. WI04-05B]|uniref:SDR family NAD(P)-dependent oxidoreductase n=1 Tax=Streptomyces TaxID=1883 RepID=UPI0029A9C548|nr:MULTISPECIES: SDR family NAD(P)-dependent oxidoreductase [unclassified Streptomyces]MDX2548131.1 SDR family NAD(P)-dependent oxidoreductase [Streptomyces sp. WI04-05B]MDX2583193.1 SDR family NAD(P)-dependent oxidoreductase [Streptomyces sp. WI04-05A]MDX3748475.1 SDR family NAD(P)-dependent oxidoreductase [Streptomyces sp. AK08-02]
MNRPIALITGSSSGIGAAYARLLADDHDLVLVARRADRLADLADELRTHGSAVEVLPADLATHDGITAVTDRLAAGDVGMLISNAGAGGYAPLVDVDPADIDRLLTLNAVAPVRLVHAALPGMLAAGEGSIVTVASLLAFSGGLADSRAPRRTLYVAAKAAVLGFTRTLAGELADTPVRVQVVCPGVVATEWNGGAGHRIPWAMPPEDVASAGLAGLHLGETVCAPGLEDQDSALDALLAAEAAFVAGGNQPTPAVRYTKSRAQGLSGSA